ncbi:hypothetical protein [Sphingomonas sp. Y38-1Y]|uniref:hypothetical protein n=1 Tax=Sphingomonas sp. Y38-1Y TaxID=3078265 RepID=UPI0028E2C10D|nr:hypothetical protein [Sphingomonas sp. Y38-1Y]
MAAKLKVYRTPIGFHDAFVAAPSQKAALAAWGADANLFARGVAEVVTDAALTKEALADPGKVIRKPRGTAAEHLAALPADTPKPKKAAATAKPSKRAPAPKPKPRPSRADLDAAEAALAEAEVAHHAALRELDAEAADLARRRRAVEAEQKRVQDRLEREQRAAERKYRAALDAWRAD